MTVRIIVGDCREILPTLDAESIDAVVTDPPYGIGFMGREWDSFSPCAVGESSRRRTRKGTLRESERWPEKNGKEGSRSQGGGVSVEYDTSASGNLRFQAWCKSWAVECFRVMKPGGFLVAFGGTRTFHRLMVGIEDAGFEVRDSIGNLGLLGYVFGSGFPKSLDVGKALDKMAGAEREIVGKGPCAGRLPSRSGGVRNGDVAYGDWNGDPDNAQTAPATDLARQWDGWGTALKPGWEPIVLARKPFKGTVAANVAANGTGALNVDACRIGADGGCRYEGDERGTPAVAVYGDGLGGLPVSRAPGLGRWPANVVLDEVAAAMLDEQSGDSKSSGGKTGAVGSGGTYNGGWNGSNAGQNAGGIGDTGGASRFFYTAKASRSERNKGLDGMPERTPHPDEPNGRAWDIPGSHSTARANHHPTVKPLDLMAWLVRLVTPPGGTVLDPFAGSGSTLVAADRQGFDAIGIEREAEYIPIIEARCRGDAPMFADVEVETGEDPPSARQSQESLPLFAGLEVAD